MISTFLDRSRARADRLIELRRDFHQHPELAYRETRTSAIVAEEVERLGFQVRRGIARTGVVAEMGTDEGPVVALRADMDALPLQEATGHAWASTVPGVMHACGHDAHTAILIGAAQLLADASGRGELPPGRVRLLFQPSEESMDEEGKSGAFRMLEEGAMEGVVAIAGLHVGAHLPLGRIVLGEGPFFAGSDEIYLTVHGRSSHAARPHQGVDALVLAAQGVMAAQQVVSRRLAPWERGVLTFGTIRGGRALNAVADRVELTGTLRYFEPGVRERIVDGIHASFAHVEAAGGRMEIRIQKGYPPLVNDRALTRRVRPVLAEAVGSDAFLDPGRVMEAEDFAYLAQKAPGVFFWLGAGLPDRREHHHPEFDIDESVLPLGAALLAATARTMLDQPDEVR
jgi:amidohydrolase